MNAETRLHELSAEYEITRELGRGGTAVVYHARERDLGREVAIKVVHQSHADDPEAVARLAREARLVAQLRHPNIVTLFGTRQLSDGSVALIMQYVPGRTLKATIREEGPLPISVVATVLREMALALHHAHQRQGLVHRDVKPENIYMDMEGGRTLLSDFGIARTTEAESTLTLVGTALGTPAYMSPEQIDGLPLDGRSDLYGLGLVAWEMLTGEQPWAGNNLYTIIYRQKHEPLPPLSEFRSDVPPHMQFAIDGLLMKDREERWPDAARFLSAMNPASASGAIAPPVMTHRSRSRPVQSLHVIEDSPTIVYRPGDVAARSSGDDVRAATDMRDERRQTASQSAPLKPALLASGSPASAAPASSPPRSASPGALSPAPSGASPLSVVPNSTPVLRFVFQDDDTVTPAAVNTAPPRRRMRRIPLLIGLAVLLSAAGAMAPLIGAGEERGVDDTGAAAPNAGADPVEAGAPDAAGAAAQLNVITGDQTGHAGEVLPVPVGLVVRDAAGSPVAGAQIEVEVTSGGGSAESLVVTDSGGLAMIRWTLGAEPGANALEARIRGVAGIAVTVRATGIAAGLQQFTAVSATEQQAPRGGTLPEPVIVRVADPSGNPVSGARVTFSVQAGGGTAQPVSATTDAGGRARTSWMIGSGGGVNTLRATLEGSGLHVDFSARPEYHLAPQPQVVAGGTHTCVLASSGEVRCWGANDDGQLGSDAAGSGAGSLFVLAGMQFGRVAAGVSHSCGLNDAGRALCWGDNDGGQLGTGDRNGRPAPTLVSTTEAFASITAGLAHTCALTESGRVYCWGSGRGEPRSVGGSRTFTMVSAGWRHTCGLTTQSTVYCWGSNGSGQLGDGTTTDRSAPVQVADEIPFVRISAGATHTCGVTAIGEAYCWGQNSSGQLGSGSRTDSPRPVRVQTDQPFGSTVAGAVHTCALAHDGQVWCWGRNNLGQLGNGNTSDSLAPVAVSGGLRFTSLSARGSHTCGRVSSGDYYCWGYNVDGQLGDGTRTDRTRPVRISVAAR